MSAIKEELKAALSQAKPTLVEFYATWCPHCQRMMPIVDELKKEMGDKANIIQIEAEKYPDIADQYDVRSYPTWVLFKDGQKFWEDAGEKPLSELKDMLNRVI